MSVFHGPQGKGAMRAHKQAKREAAQERDAALSIASPRRRAVRRTIDGVKQILDLAAGGTR